jgi:redox-sensitive bicupin YhaK (pirin superfamily)
VVMVAGPDHTYLLLRPEDHAVLGESDFGMPGLTAIEAIGPFVDVQVSGPLVTVHDSVVEAGLGIGHHPHRHHERLFFIERGELDHDDALNGITGHMGEGDVGQFTEGQRGMVHSEWNHGSVDTRAYILVSTTDPVPPRTAFTVLHDADAPRYEESARVRTKELVGARSPLRVNGDIRSFTEARIDPDGEVEITLGEGEGGVVSIREGVLRLGEEDLTSGTTLILPPSEVRRSLSVRAARPSRVIRVVHGPGAGFVRGRPMPRRGGPRGPE